MRTLHPLHRNIGRFVVTMDDIRSLPEWLYKLMDGIIVVKADFAFDKDGIEYTAISERFAAVPENQEVPRYAYSTNGEFVK